MKISHSSLLIAASCLLAACSIYESPGRKALENGAFGIANGTISFTGCTTGASDAHERFLTEDDQVRVFQQDGDPKQVQIDLKDSSRLSCHYQFISMAAIGTHLQDAIHHALDQRTVER